MSNRLASTMISKINLPDKVLNNHIIAVSIGILYFWFGVLKFFPGLSPAEVLAKDTIAVLTFSLIPSHVSIILLAIWETALGLLFITNSFRPMAIRIAYVHLALTFTPFLIFDELTFANPPFGFSLVGQYIVKNIILIAALITLSKMSPEKSNIG